ncbi:MAG: cell division protein FtsQ/DivIB [Mangrovibacterium sp.]
MHTLVKIILVLLALSVISLSLLFSERKLKEVKCGGLVVTLTENSARIMQEDELAALVKQADSSLFDRVLYALNTEKLERSLEKVSSVKKAEFFRQVYVEGYELKGRLAVVAELRKPLFRIISGNDDYYMDEQGVRIERKENFTARVPVVTGSAGETYARERLLPMVRYLAADRFWLAQVQQIHVLENGEIQLVQLAGDQLVEFGEPEGFRIKFRNLKALYMQGFAETGWSRYSKISLKYENQIVCTKK